MQGLANVRPLRLGPVRRRLPEITTPLPRLKNRSSQSVGQALGGSSASSARGQSRLCPSSANHVGSRLCGSAGHRPGCSVCEATDGSEGWKMSGSSPRDRGARAPEWRAIREDDPLVRHRGARSRKHGTLHPPKERGGSSLAGSSSVRAEANAVRSATAFVAHEAEDLPAGTASSRLQRLCESAMHSNNGHSV